MTKLTEYIREKDVLEQWPMSKATMIRARKDGLKFVRLGCFVCYKPEDLEEYFSKPRSLKADTSSENGGSKYANR